jgi:hypothetical protein
MKKKPGRGFELIIAEVLNKNQKNFFLDEKKKEINNKTNKNVEKK